MLAAKLLSISTTLPATSLTFVSVTTTNDTTAITLPTVQDGDIAILVDSNVQTSTRAAVTPTSWTSLTTIEYSPPSLNVFNRVCVSYRLMTASLSGTSVTGIDTTAGLVFKMLYVFRPSSSITSVSFGGAIGAGHTSANPTTSPLVITSSGSTSPFTLVYGHHRGAGDTTGTASITMSPSPTYTTDVTLASRTNLLVVSGTPSNTTINMQFVSANTFAIYSGGYISISL